MQRYQRKRVDLNQKTIVEELRRNGFSVLHIHTIGHGCPDILVSKNGISVLVEIKKDKKSLLTEDEKRFHSTWQGCILTVTTAQDIINHFKKEIS